MGHQIALVRGPIRVFESSSRVYVVTTIYEGNVAFRLAIVNWRTREEDVDLLVSIPQLGAALR
ncbi:MAG: hypothetical protein ACRDKA_13210 [Actinomycetota bacterium]